MGWPHKYSNPLSLKLVKQLTLDPTVALTGRRLPSGMVTEDCRDLSLLLEASQEERMISLIALPDSIRAFTRWA